MSPFLNEFEIQNRIRVCSGGLNHSTHDRLEALP